MRPDLCCRMPGLILCVTGALSGCALLEPGGSQAGHQDAPLPDRGTSAALSVADILEQVRRLAEAMPAQQSEMVATAQREFELAPSPTHQLRYASMLAVPGIGASDSETARRLLRELAAKPEALMPAERSLAMIELTQVDHRLQVESENQRLQTSAERNDREHSAALNKRLQTELDENARLKKELDEAQAKLDAIANIERSLSERHTTSEAHRP